MKVRDILEVSEYGTSVYPNLIRDYKWLLCESSYSSYDEVSVRKSFQKNLNRREKAHERALQRNINDEGFTLIPWGLLQEKTVLNRNVTSFDELLNMEVAKVSSKGSQGGFSHVVVYVKDIYVIDRG